MTLLLNTCQLLTWDTFTVKFIKLHSHRKCFTYLRKNIKYDSFIEYADSKVTVQCIIELPLSDRQIFSDTGGPRLEKRPPGMTLFGWVRLSPILTEIDTKTLHKCVVYDQSIMSSTAGSWHYVGPSQFLNVRSENGCYWIDCCCFKSNLNQKKDKNILQDNQSIFLWISNYKSL